MKNVIILAVSGLRCAVELRWVREVLSLGEVTMVPGAPDHILGVANIRGAITPVLELGVLMPTEPGARRRSRATTHSGTGAVILDVDGLVAALRIDTVDEVSTVSEIADLPVTSAVVSGTVADSRNRPVPLLAPPELVRVARARAEAVRAAYVAKVPWQGEAGGSDR